VEVEAAHVADVFELEATFLNRRSSASAQMLLNVELDAVWWPSRTERAKNRSRRILSSALAKLHLLTCTVHCMFDRMVIELIDYIIKSRDHIRLASDV
jgi:hypothetical protein